MKNDFQKEEKILETSEQLAGRPGTLSSFYRSQVSAGITTALDFLVTIFLKEIVGVWYVLATATGALVGTIFNFFVGRRWVFKSREMVWWKQALRYAVVSVGSLALNTYGVYFLVETFGLNYIYAKIIIGLMVGVFWNFLLQKYFVYK